MGSSLKRSDDYLWLLKYRDQNDRIGVDYQRMLAKLEHSRVPTTRDAEGLALAHKMRVLGGVLAEEQWRVVALLISGVDEPGFASRGDFVWVVRFTHSSGQTTYEVWIGSATGSPSIQRVREDMAADRRGYQTARC